MPKITQLESSWASMDVQVWLTPKPVLLIVARLIEFRVLCTVLFHSGVDYVRRPASHQHCGVRYIHFCSLGFTFCICK